MPPVSVCFVQKLPVKQDYSDPASVQSAVVVSEAVEAVDRQLQIAARPIEASSVVEPVAVGKAAEADFGTVGDLLAAVEEP